MSGKKYEQPIRQDDLPRGNTAGLEYETVQAYLTSADASSLQGLATAYGVASAALETAQTNMAKHVQRLVGAEWTGEASELAQGTMKGLDAAGTELAAATEQFQNAMTAAGRVVQTYKTSLPSKQDEGLSQLMNPNPGTESPAEAENNRQAQQHLAQMNTGLGAAYDGIPESVTLPDWKYDGERFGGNPNGSTGGNGPGGSGTPSYTSEGGGSGSVSPGGGANPGSGSVPGAGGGGGMNPAPSPNPTDLSKVPLSGPGLGGAPGTLPGEGSGIPPGLGGTAPGAPGMPGPGTPGGLGPILPGMGGSVPGGLGPRGSGSAGGLGGFGAGGAGAKPGVVRGLGPGGIISGESAIGLGGGRGAPGSSMMPMGGGAAGGSNEEDRDRQAWLPEDEDAWRDDGDVAPPVIG